MSATSSLPINTLTLQNDALSFTALTCGWTDNPQGEIIICLHGFPDNARSFRHQLPILASAGYRVVAPTLRGYEPSSIPRDNQFGLTHMVGDLIAWIDGFGVDKVHLIGHDWGASITYLAGVMAPQRFSSLTTIAVPNGARFLEGIQKVPRQRRLSWYMMFFQLPIIADFMVERRDWQLIRKLWRDWSPGYTLNAAEWAQLRETFGAPGVKTSMLAYYRQNMSLAGLLGFQSAEATRAFKIGAPTLAITGADDGCIATELYDYTMLEDDFPAGLRVKRIPNAGHFVHQEVPDVVNPILLDWIASAG